MGFFSTGEEFEHPPDMLQKEEEDARIADSAGDVKCSKIVPLHKS